MYVRPPFIDNFDRPDGELLSPWVVRDNGTLDINGNSVTSSLCGLGVLPFSGKNFSVSAVLSAFGSGSLAALLLKCDSGMTRGFSVSVQADLTLHLEAVGSDGTGGVIARTTPISVGDSFGLYHYTEDGVQKLRVTGGGDTLVTVVVPPEYLDLIDGTHCGIWLSSPAALSEFTCEEVADITLPLVPLQKSWEANEVETDLKNLFIRLYDEHLSLQAEEMTVYGMPHLGQFSLIERLVTQDGLAVIRQGDESGLRYLYKAWKHNNPKRGLHFIRTYLQVLFGDAYDVAQLWQEKIGQYPESLKTAAEISLAAEDLADYFLTSRIRVDLDTDLIPNNIIRSLKTALAARFVLEMRIAKFFESELFIGAFLEASSVLDGYGESLAPAKMSANDYTFLNIGNASVVFDGYGELI